MPMVTPRTFEFGFAWRANSAGAPTIPAAGIAASAIRPSSRLVYRMTVAPSKIGTWLSLSLHAAGGVARRQAIHLLHGDAVEVTGNGVLERARGNRKAERRFRQSTGDEPVNQPRGEAVATADPIDDAHVVGLASVKRRRSGVPQDRAPSVVAGRAALAQGDRHHLRTEVPR